MKNGRILKNLIRFAAYSSQLQELIFQQYEYLLQDRVLLSNVAGITAEPALNVPTDPINDEALVQDLYELVWGEIIEEEVWDENSLLATHANEALPNSRSPYGYRFIYRANRPTLCLDEIESQVVKLIYHWYLHANMTLRVIAKTLSELGLPTPYNIHHKVKGNSQAGWGQWDTTVIHRILSSSTYHGSWTYHDSHLNKKITIQVPAIVHDAQFEAVQAKLVANQNYRATDVPNFIYSQRVKCGACGSLTRLVRIKTVHYCRCTTKTCPTRGFILSQIDEIVFGWLFERLQMRQIKQKALKAYRQQYLEELQSLDNTLAILESYSQKYIRQIKILDKFDLPLDSFSQAKERYESRLNYAVNVWKEKSKQLQKNRNALVKVSGELSILALKQNLIEQKRLMNAIHMQVWIKGRNKGRHIRIQCDLGEGILLYRGGESNE